MKKNLLNKTTTYLIGHMETDNGRGWRERVTNKFAERGIVCFDPYHKPFVEEVSEDEIAREKLDKLRKNRDWEPLHEHFKQVRGDDLRCVDKSDFVVVYIKPDKPTWGTMEEMSWAVRQKKPVFIAIEGGREKTPLWFFGMMPSAYFFDTLEELIGHVLTIDDGLIALDKKRWRLFKQEYR